MSEIVGRDEELATLVAFVDGPFPAAVLIEGEPGIGKTTLWRHGVERAAARGRRVLAASPTESETQLPFATIGDLLGESVGDVLDEVPSPQRHALEVALLLGEPGAAPPDRRAIAVALLSALRVLAAASPLVVAVDDVQWLDAASRDALEFGLRRIQAEDIKFLFARRSGTADPLPLGLDRLSGATGVERIRVGALSLGAIGELLRERLGVSFRRPTLNRIQDVSGGNPFYALELGAALLRDAVDVGGDDLPLPGALRDLVRRRIAALPSATTETLLVVAALADPTTAVVAEVVGAPLDERLDAAFRAGVVEVESGRIRFTHPLLRSAVYSDVPLEARRTLHARLAALDLPIEERARHLALSANAPNQSTAQLLEDAARAAALRGAPEAAAELATHSTRLTPDEDIADRHRRTILTGRNVWAAGDYERGRQVLEAAVKNAPDLESKAGALLLLAKNPRNIAESQRLCEEALDAAPPTTALRVDVLLFLAELDYALGNSKRAISYLESAVEVTKEIGDPTREAFAVGLLSWLRGVTGGGWDLDALRHAAQVEIAVSPRPVLDGLVYICGLALLWTDNLDEARRTLGDLAARGSEAGDITRIEIIQILAQAEVRAGEIEQAQAHFDEAVELAEQFGLEQLEANARAARAMLDALRGRVEATRETCEWLREASERTSEGLMQIRTAAILGLLELSLGDASSARRELERGLEELDRFGIRDPGIYAIFALAVDAMVESSDLERAEELTRSLEQFAAVHPRPRALVYAHRCRGIVHAAKENFDEALRSLERAVVDQKDLPVPFERALTFLWRGRVERRARRRRAARESLEQAAAIFEELGFPLWLERVHEEIRRIGGRTASGDELTEAERRVATLVAEGRTNKEVAAELVVSVRAVEANLSRIYSKLGVRSRAELAHRYRTEEDVGVR